MGNSTTESLQRAGCYIVDEVSIQQSRTKGVLAEDQNLKAGTIVAKISSNTSAATSAKAGNVGNGVMGAVTVTDPAKEGKYTVRITAASANAGSFAVRDPDGDLVGNGTVAVAFNQGGIAFTLADGATDFAVGDEIYIKVDLAEGVWTQLNTAGTDGSETALGILFASVDATDAVGGLPCVVSTALMTYNPSEVIWPDAIAAADKSAAISRLLERHIKPAPVY